MLSAFEPVQPDEGFVSIQLEIGTGKEQVIHEYCYEAR